MFARFALPAVVAGCVAVLLTGCGMSRADSGAITQNARPRSAQTLPLETGVFATPERVRASMIEAKPDRDGCVAYRAGVVNHHALADDLLADFFRRLAVCRPDLERVIILSPDHFHAGITSLSTHTADYRTESGLIHADVTTTERLLEALPFVRQNNVLFEREHGIGALIPFLHVATPQARYVAIAVSPNITQSDAEQATVWLKEAMAVPGTFVLVSSDMSHYLTEAQALANDQETLAAFSQNTIPFFWNARDTHTDSGRSLWMVQKALEKSTWQKRKESISSRYGGSALYTTSYLTGFWE